MAVRFIQGGFMGMTSVSGNTIAIDVIPSRRRGEGMGFYGLTINLAMSLAPLVAVAVYDRYGFHPLVLVGLAIALVGVGSVCLIRYPETGEGGTASFFAGSFYSGESVTDGIGLPVECNPLWDGCFFRRAVRKRDQCVESGYFFIFMAIGVGTARLISGRLVDHGKIHLVSISALVFLTLSFAVFALFHNEIVFASALAIGIGFGVCVPAIQCLFRKCRSASYAWNGNFHLSDFF